MILYIYIYIYNCTYNIYIIQITPELLDLLTCIMDAASFALIRVNSDSLFVVSNQVTSFAVTDSTDGLKSLFFSRYRL